MSEPSYGIIENGTTNYALNRKYYFEIYVPKDYVNLFGGPSDRSRIILKYYGQEDNYIHRNGLYFYGLNMELSESDMKYFHDRLEALKKDEDLNKGLVIEDSTEDNKNS